MTVTRHSAEAQLPTSHYFVTLARGASIRTVTVRTGVLRGGIAVLAMLGCWLAASTLYLGFHDDVVSALVARETAMQYAYEDRIAILRKQVERQASVAVVSQSTLDGKMSELARRASALEMRASIVAQMAERTGLPRPNDRAPVRAALQVAPGDPVDNPWSSEATGTTARAGSGLPQATRPSDKAMAPAPQEKPHPEADAGPSATPSDGAVAAHGRVSDIEATLERIDGSQYRAIATVATLARKKSETLRAVLADAGITPERMGAAPPPASTGGPFVPLDEGVSTSPFGRAVLALQGEVAVAEELRRVVGKAPLASPVAGPQEVTSPFGARVDPFLGRLAMHTGVDLREDTGTEVKATAAGMVASAGPAGGYGTMIELDHGHGLSTRYAHLSAVLVSEGQRVEKGAVIGRVGSTGRATGPHLHYETRIDGTPVDPMRFLAAGQRLAAAEPTL